VLDEFFFTSLSFIQGKRLACMKTCVCFDVESQSV